MTTVAQSNLVVRIGIVAGEASGDLLAAPVMAALQRRLPQVRFCGIGGAKMQRQGMDVWWPAEHLSVHGYADALRNWRRIRGIRQQLLKRFLQDPPAIFIGVDAPDFNLGVEKRLKAADVPTIHYISPSLWAWRGRRIHTIGQAADRVLTLFPFEPALYEKAGVPVTFVGHPLADSIPLATAQNKARQILGIAPETKVIALLPGSRASELEHMATLFIAVAQRLNAEFPEVQFIVPLVTRKTRDIFEAAIWKQQMQNLPIRLLFGHGQDALAAANVALVASGTATLEALLVKTPMIITYRLSPWSAFIMQRMRYQPWIGLPNILAGKFIAPEYVQKDATPEKIAPAMRQLLQDKVDADYQVRSFENIHLSLRNNAAETAATAILSELAARTAQDSPLAALINTANATTAITDDC